MIKKITGFFILILYTLVLATSVTHGALISIPSLALGLIGLITIILFLSTIAKNIRLVDIPDTERKTHSGSVPLIGGIAIYISIIYGTYIMDLDPFFRVLIYSLIPILIVGVLDDIRGMPVPIRLIAQIISSWIVILASGIYLVDLGDLFGFGSFVLGNFGIPFTIFAVVGICNAFNMLDGKDGLAGSVSLVIISSLFIAMTLKGATYNWAIIMILSLFIFLLFNLDLFGKNRKIFLGDHGSLGLGHVIAWNLIYLSQDTAAITPVSALWFTIYPLTDAILTFIRRIRSGKAIFDADRKHFHHILSDLDISNNIILLIAIFISAIGSTVAILGNMFDIAEYLTFYLYLTVISFLLILGAAKP